MTLMTVFVIILVVLALGVLIYSYYLVSNLPVGTGQKASHGYVVEQVASKSNTTVVIIPQGARIAPPQFNVTELLTNKYAYPFNFTVVLGVNNTVEWLNHDITEHTVSSFVVPTGAQTWSSGLIQPNGTFTQTLTVPGIYKYTCIWHPWLAGEIRVTNGTT
jgi:hypothetical protein